ncbi:hypothetical protein KR032_004226 [Drosophila birchii]|nr:hypothetical protein KR032_004226 [Drosophila birchii]
MPVPLVAKVLSLRRTSTNQQQNQTQEDESFQSEPKEGIPLPKNGRLIRRWKPYALYRNIVKILLAVLVVCALYGMIPMNRRRELKKTQETSEKVIMVWNEDQRRLAKGSAHMECGCVVTSRRKDYERAVDAIVFIAERRYSMEYISKINRTHDFLSVFAARNPLSLVKDPPQPAPGERSLFNLTMTYRLDSQLVWSEYYFSLHNQAKRVNSFRAPSAHYADDMPSYEMQLVQNNTIMKDRLTMYVIYEVDDDSTAQSRYLEKLRKHVNLEAYMSCLRGRQCGLFYFLLIFDSDACPDYVPTQMFEAMYKFVVPVLIGGGNLNKLVPPHSYISSRDFPDPKDLAAYMKYLVKAPDEYKRYFWWHSLYKLRRTVQPYCQLCTLLQQPQEERHIETSFAHWWTKYQCPKRLTTFL